MTPEIEKALGTEHSRTLVTNALREHARSLTTQSKKDSALGYPEASREKKGDADHIDEVILPAFGSQTGLELDHGAEIRAYVAGRVLVKGRALKARLDDENGAAPSNDAVVKFADEIADEVVTLIGMIAERAHHDGRMARELDSPHTIARVLRELTGKGAED